MLTIIQGNDTTVSVLLHSQSLTLPDNEGRSYVERSKIDLSQAKDISVRLIPYMRWRPITPSFEVKSSTISIHYPASVQRPGKWDVEIIFLTPEGGGYRQNRVRQAFAEVIACAKGANSPEAYVITADVAQAVQGSKGNPGDKGDPGKSSYELAQEEEGFTGTKKEYLKSLHGEPGKDLYQAAVERGYTGSFDEFLELQKGAPGDPGKSNYEREKELKGFQGTEEEYLTSLHGAPGEGIYEMAVRKGFVGSEEAYLKSQKGKDAYQSYLDNTSDNPKLTEKQWAKVNDYHAQIIHAIIYGTQSMTKEYTGAELYDLSKHLRSLNRLLQSRGVGVTEESPLVDLIKAVELAPSFPEAILVYKDQQFDNFPDASLPTLIFSPIYNKAYYTFWKSKLQTLPPLLGVDKITSTEGMCDSSDVLGVAKVGEAVSLTRMDRMFYGCSSLSGVHISTSPALVNMEMAFGNCGALTSIVGVIDVSNVTRSNNTFLACVSLRDVKLKGLSNSIDLNNCRELSAESLRYLVDNAQQVTGKTITLSSRLPTRPELKETLEYVGAKAVDKGFSVVYR